MKLEWPNLPEELVDQTQSAHGSVDHQATNLEAPIKATSTEVIPTEDPSPSQVPADPTPENDPEVSSLNNNTMESFPSYMLPHRQNRGKPPNRYDPDDHDIPLQTIYGSDNITSYLAETFPSLITTQNSQKDTILHLATREGKYSDIIKSKSKLEIE
uniref:PGG domain-containing protein n=1 Tax=Salix viminalis TaxID=40686 RepID=A0A6N2MGP1_SALVM